jgi:hypothetical protein
MTKEEMEFRIDVLLSVHRALLGMIYPSIRAITIGYKGEIKFRIAYYLDREPVEEDYESISIVAGNVLADLDFSEVEERCYNAPERIIDFKKMELVYFRKEEYD